MTIVIGAVLAIAAVIATGGLALVPILTTALTTLGVSAGTAMTIATVISLTTAGIAILSTVGSSALNIVDIWCKIDNPIFNTWQKGLNIVSAISNSAYSIGNIYNSLTGVSGKEFIARQKALENGKLGYSNLESNHPRMKHKEGAVYDQTRKKAVYTENRNRNNGVLRRDKTGKVLETPSKSVKGVKPPVNEAQVDHILARAHGGTNSFSNAQVIERSVNIAKSNSFSFTNADYLNYSMPDQGSLLRAFGFGFLESIQVGQNVYSLKGKKNENKIKYNICRII